MTRNADALAALADARGIERDFRDYRDEPVSISLQARARILELMGYETSARAAQSALRKLQREREAQRLPPVVIITEGAPLALTLHLAPSLYTPQLTLEIDCDDGSRMTIEVGSELGSEPDHGDAEARCLSVQCPLPVGYHRATLRGPDTGAGNKAGNKPGISVDTRLDTRPASTSLATTRIIVTPQCAFLPRAIEDGRRLSGVSVQLYTLRSGRNWGMGDFTDLAELIRALAIQGVDVVGVNPLHALFPAEPLHFSPYSPSHRAFLNVMYIDPEAVAECSVCEAVQAQVSAAGFQDRLQALRDCHDVDYAGVARCKLDVMEALYRYFRDVELPAGTQRAQSFKDFVDSRGEALRLHALYDCLSQHFAAEDTDAWGWPAWPAEFQDKDSDTVQRFARDNADRVQFFSYLQWCADEQLRGAQALAESLGMGVGIYLDIAVGADRNGSEVWSNRNAFAIEASAGAPPDELARTGQDWGFPPLCPRHLHNTAYELFVQNLRANMSLCGAVRYDHAVSLLRLWWIPRHLTAADGAYVRYPLDTLLGLLALESQRQRCLVIGEDLGTVPATLTAQMQARHIFAYKVLYFEKSHERMTFPWDYPKDAAATITTHDLPTLASWWEGSDIDLRADLGLLGGAAAADEMRATRRDDRHKLLASLKDADCWHDSSDPDDYPQLTHHLNAAVHYYLARSRAALMLTQLEDLMQMHAPVNVPGTFREYANWQRKLRFPLEDLFARAEPAALCAAIRAGRRH